MTHQSLSSSSNDYHLELLATLLGQDKILLDSLRQREQQHSTVTATSSTLPTFDRSTDYPLQEQGIPETFTDFYPLQELFYYDCQQEHNPSCYQYFQLYTKMQSNNYQAEVINLYTKYLNEVCPIIYVIFLLYLKSLVLIPMVIIFKYHVKNFSSTVFLRIYQQRNNPIYHGVCPHPSPPLTPSETASASNIIADITSNDFAPTAPRGSEAVSCGSSSTSQSENLSANGDDEGSIGHCKESSDGAKKRFYC